MELKVSVEGVERSVSGINESTTCAQIIYALAHATSQKGRFAMIEKFRNKERRLSPNDHPLELLQKWREQASSVTFVLKRIDDDDSASNSTITSNNGIEPQHPMSFYRTPSTSSTVSAMPGTLNHSMSNFQHPNRSSSSLPAFPAGAARPPPPDYKTVMDQKFASLSRGAQQRPSIPIPKEEPSMIPRLNQKDILDLIEKQRQIIEKQKESLAKSERNLPTSMDRELLQLERQQENLRLVLEPMREANWPQHYQAELKTSHKLRASIEATKEAIDKNALDLARIAKEEQAVLEQIAQLEREEQSDIEIPSIHLMTINESPHKLRAF